MASAVVGVLAPREVAAAIRQGGGALEVDAVAAVNVLPARMRRSLVGSGCRRGRGRRVLHEELPSRPGAPLERPHQVAVAVSERGLKRVAGPRREDLAEHLDRGRRRRRRSRLAFRLRVCRQLCPVVGRCQLISVALLLRDDDRNRTRGRRRSRTGDCLDVAFWRPMFDAVSFPRNPSRVFVSLAGLVKIVV